MQPYPVEKLKPGDLFTHDPFFDLSSLTKVTNIFGKHCYIYLFKFKNRIVTFNGIRNDKVNLGFSEVYYDFYKIPGGLSRIRQINKIIARVILRAQPKHIDLRYLTLLIEPILIDLYNRKEDSFNITFGPIK